MDRKSLRTIVSPFVLPSDHVGIASAGLDIAVLVCLATWSFQAHSLAAKIAIAPLSALAMARMFVLGHDACHGGLHKSPLLNQVLGRVLFLPTLTPYSLWDIGHNTIHHGFTNLKGRDNVWTPLTLEEWTGLSPWHRKLQRFYRSVFGLGFYYLIEIWWAKLLFVSRSNRIARRREHIFDRLLVTVFAAAIVALVLVGSPGFKQKATNLALSIIAPFVMWCWLIGFTTYVQHTHPTVEWYERKDEWTFQVAQVECTIHVAFPPWWNWLLHNIYEHTAHHVNVKIPYYHLRQAQAALEAALGDTIPIIRWNAVEFLRSLHTCQLYDYMNKRWLRFPPS